GHGAAAGIVGDLHEWLARQAGTADADGAAQHLRCLRAEAAARPGCAAAVAAAQGRRRLPPGAAVWLSAGAADIALTPSTTAATAGVGTPVTARLAVA